MNFAPVETETFAVFEEWQGTLLELDYFSDPLFSADLDALLHPVGGTMPQRSDRVQEVITRALAGEIRRPFGERFERFLKRHVGYRKSSERRAAKRERLRIVKTVPTRYALPSFQEEGEDDSPADAVDRAAELPDRAAAVSEFLERLDEFQETVLEARVNREADTLPAARRQIDRAARELREAASATLFDAPKK